MVGQLDPAYSSMEKRGAAYVPSVAEYGKKRKTTRNIAYAAGCICGVGLAVWMVYITLMVNKGAVMREQQRQVLVGPDGLNYSGFNVKQGMELKAMKSILVHMAQEQAASRLEENPDEMKRRTANSEVAPRRRSILQLLGDLEFKPEKNPWITRGSSSVLFVAFFAEDRSPLVESTEEESRKDIRRAKSASWKKLDIERSPNQQQNKDFVFSLRDKGGCWEIETSSGLKAVASSSSSVVLEQVITTTTTTTTTIPATTTREDLASYIKEKTSTTSPTQTTTPKTTTTLATETLGPSCWILATIKDKFITVESATHRGKFWSTSTGYDGALVLREDPELFTGIHTNFILDVSLGRSNVNQPNQPTTPIPENMYGDIKIRYLNTQGEEETGYVCDNEWGYDDAASVCSSLWPGKTGIPTYRGRFTGLSENINFAMSGLSCRKEDSFKDCGFKTDCSDSRCQAQKSLGLLNGKGMANFACNSHDAAGVVCGTEEQIMEIRKKEMTASCNSSAKASSRQSIGQMASLEQQAKKVSELMTENKHWSEFLIPLPMTVSLMSMLMLISAQYEGKVELPRPAKGEWDELKWDLLTPNLYELNGIVTDAFDRSTTAMKKINVNSEEMNVELVNSIKWGSSQSTVAKRKWKRSLRNIAEFAKQNLEETDETIKRFDHANRFIQELLSAMKNTQKLQEDEKQKLTIGLAAMKNQTNRDQDKLEEQEKLFEEYKEQVKTTRDELYKAAKALEESSCIMDEGCTKEGTRFCEKCVYRPTHRLKHSNGTDICITSELRCLKDEVYCKKNETVCENYVNGDCQQFGDRCKTTKEVDDDCNIFGKNCNKKTLCTARETYCMQYKQVCGTQKSVCVESALKCATNENTCIEYEMVPAGSFCEDDGGCCSGCAGREEMKEVLSNVLQTSMMLDIQSLEDDSNIEVIHSIVEVTQGISSKIYEKINKVPGSRSKRQANETEDQTTPEKAEDEIIEEEPLKVNEETLQNEIRMFLVTLPLQRRQLEQMANKNPLAKEAQLLLGDFEQVISKIDVNTPASTLENFQKTSFNVVNDKIKSFAITIAKEAKSLEIDLSQSSFKGPSGVSEKAEAYMENKIKRIKAARQIDSLSQNLESALAQMATQKIDLNDFKKTINYLISCAQYLSQLKVAWGSIKDFFSRLGGLLERVRGNTRKIKEEFEDILIYISESVSETIETDLEKTTVKATAFNIFTKKVSGFYVAIMERGLLQKIRGLNFDRLRPEVLQDTKDFILNEARAMQSSISDTVSAEQAELNDELNQKMWNIQNMMSCSLKNVKNQSKLKLLENLKDKEKEVARIEEVVGKKDDRGLDHEVLVESGLLEDEDTLAAEDGATYDLWADPDYDSDSDSDAW